MTRDTVGKISSKLLLNAHDDSHSAEEQMRESLTDFEKNMEISIQRFKKMFAQDFYIIVLTKKERLMMNVLRNYFTGRLSCPTPEYDQAVYKYTLKKDHLEFLWVVPSKDACQMIKEYPLELPEEGHELRNFVLSFYDGTLLHKAKLLNGEIA